MSNNILYEDDECKRFNDSLDEEGYIEIAGIAFQRSRILYELASNTYFDAYNEFQEQEFHDLQQTVFSTYPACIAYNYRLTEKGEGANDPVRKLLHLKDTWEAIVFVLYALVMGEVRFRNIEMKTLQIFVSPGTGGNPIYANCTSEKILSDAIKQKIQITKAIILHCKNNNLGFKCVKIDETLLDDLLDLQDIRNDISHHTAPTREQAESELSSVIPLFQKMLAKTMFLESCNILRFENYTSVCRCETFNGHYLNREYEDYPFQGPQKTLVLSLGQEQLFVNWDEDCFSLSPFLHFFRDESGHESFISFFKRKKNGKYWFEPIKIRTEKTFDHIHPRFEIEKDDLVRILVP
jgi:hypothetical protein